MRAFQLKLTATKREKNEDSYDPIPELELESLAAGRNIVDFLSTVRNKLPEWEFLWSLYVRDENGHASLIDDYFFIDSAMDWYNLLAGYHHTHRPVDINSVPESYNFELPFKNEK